MIPFKKIFIFIFILNANCYSQSEDLTYFIKNDTLKSVDFICLEIRNNSKKNYIIPIEEIDYFLKHTSLVVTQNLKNNSLLVFTEEELADRPTINFSVQSSIPLEKKKYYDFNFIFIKPMTSLELSIPFFLISKKGNGSISEAGYSLDSQKLYFLKIIYSPRYFISYNRLTENEKLLIYKKQIISNKVPIKWE